MTTAAETWRDNPFRVHLRVVSGLLRREMATKYGRSAGGYLWALAEPVGMIALLSLAFALVARRPSLGETFIVFFATGYLPFALWRQVATEVASALRANLPLLQYPNVALIDAITARFVLQVLTFLLVATVILSGAVVWTGEALRPEPALIAMALGLAALTGLAMGLINIVAFRFLPVWEQIYRIGTRPLLILSAVFYLPEDLPPELGDILWWNPLAHVVTLFREGFYPVYRSDFSTPAWPLGLGLVGVLLGLLLIRSAARSIAQA